MESFKKTKEVPVMKVDYKTDIGKKRSQNEDSLVIDEKRGIYLLADGMGGHQAGEVASRMAVEVAYDSLVHTIARDTSDDDIPGILKEALFKAHDAIKLSTKIDIDYEGMGTTLIQMVVRKDRAYVCNTGDSRIYLIRDKIRQVTKDQTWGDYLVEHKNIEPEKIPAQSWHILTQAVGVTANIRPELKRINLKDNDVLLMCSDGLTDMLSDEEIEHIVIESKEDAFNKAAVNLVDAANIKGGRDNISVVLVKYNSLKIEVECTAFSLNKC
jgi:PPM family protein phosphatase